MGMQGEKVVALDQTDVCIAAVAPTPTPTRRPGGGGGGTPTDTYTGSGTLKINSAGTVLKSVKINAEDGIGSLLIPIGTEALDAGGNPLTEISLIPVSNDTAPAFPSGAAFQFAGYVYEASPEGATFEPGITLYIEIPEDVWNTLDLTDQRLTVKWYNKQTGEWEDVPTTVSASTRTVRATISHFSTFALFTEPVTTATPTDTATPATPATPTTPGDETPDEGLPFTTILVIVIAVVIIAAAGYYFMTKK